MAGAPDFRPEKPAASPGRGLGGAVAGIGVEAGTGAGGFAGVDWAGGAPAGGRAPPLAAKYFPHGCFFSGGSLKAAYQQAQGGRHFKQKTNVARLLRGNPGILQKEK